VKYAWCWRCEAEMPMLDADEFVVARGLFGQAFRTKGTMKERFAPLIEWHEKVTGLRIEQHNAIIHHELAALGRPCPSCGKPFRTPVASHCAACGHTD